MTRHKINPLRALTDEKRGVLTQISRSASAPARHVAHAKALLAAANGLNYQAAAHAAGRRAGDAVAHLLPSVPTTLRGGNALAETKISLKRPLRPETTHATDCLKPQMGSV